MNELQTARYSNHSHGHHVNLQKHQRDKPVQKKRFEELLKRPRTAAPKDVAAAWTSLEAAAAAAQAAAASLMTDEGVSEFGRHVVLERSTCTWRSMYNEDKRNTNAVYRTGTAAFEVWIRPC